MSTTGAAGGRPLRIALVHAFHWDDVPRGGERYLRDLSTYLGGAGHEVDVVVGTDGPASVDDELGVTIRRLPHRLRRTSARVGARLEDAFGTAVLRLLIGHRYDVVHSLTPSATIVSRACRQTTVHTVMGHPTREQWARTPGRRRLYRAAARVATGVTAYSEASARAVTDVFGPRAAALTLGIWPDDFAADLRPRTGPPRLLLCGYPGEPRKGVREALLAMPGVLDAHPDARLQLLGDRTQHERWHAELGPDRARVLAAVDDLGRQPMAAMPALYRAATVALLPSRDEAFGVSLVESLACGTPVVCSADGGMPEIVDDERIGRVSPTGDVGALTAHLLEAIALAGEERTPLRCARHALRWDWRTRVGPAHEEYYRALLRRGAGG